MSCLSFVTSLRPRVSYLEAKGFHEFTSREDELLIDIALPDTSVCDIYAAIDQGGLTAYAFHAVANLRESFDGKVRMVKTYYYSPTLNKQWTLSIRVRTIIEMT